MPDRKVLNKLKQILVQNVTRSEKARRSAEAIREAGPHRWVGIYQVDARRGLVSNIAWSGPGGPAYPTFPVSKGLTSRAIAEMRTVNVGDVANDAAYLPALDTTRSEIIVPVIHAAAGHVVGTIDVESEHVNAFNSEAQEFLEDCANLLVELCTSSD